MLSGFVCVCVCVCVCVQFVYFVSLVTDSGADCTPQLHVSYQSIARAACVARTDSLRLGTGSCVLTSSEEEDQRSRGRSLDALPA